MAEGDDCFDVKTQIKGIVIDITICINKKNSALASSLNTISATAEIKNGIEIAENPAKTANKYAIPFLIISTLKKSPYSENCTRTKLLVVPPRFIGDKKAPTSEAVTGTPV